MANELTAGTGVGTVALRQRPDAAIHFWIARGWIDDLVNVRGANGLTGGKAGRERGVWVADTRRIVLNGSIKGSGASEDAAAADFDTLLQSLAPFWDPTADPWTLTVLAPYKGLASGTATIDVVTVNLAPSAQLTTYRRSYSWEVESISDPPDWVRTP